MRIALVSLLLLLAACQFAVERTNEAEPAPPPPAADGDVSAAEQLVRRRLGTTGEIHFSGATRSASDGVRIVCGRYEQGGASHRYIVVDDRDAFVESQMAAGEMDRAVAEFCREGGDNGPARRVPPAGEEG